MSTSHLTCLAVAALVLSAPLSAASMEDRDIGVGTQAPELVAAAWVGTPVTLSAVHGNTVVLAFWNADIPC